MLHACSVAMALYDDYRRAVRAWARSINALEDGADLQMFARIDEDRFRAMLAKYLYHNHLAEHVCENGDATAVLRRSGMRLVQTRKCSGSSRRSTRRR
jgi:hypothetical protein